MESGPGLFISILSCQPLIGNMCFDFFARIFGSKEQLASRVTTMVATRASTKLSKRLVQRPAPIDLRAIASK